MNDSSKLPRRRRFQFSLRTLMICVLAYGCCWLLTIRWGGYQLVQAQVNEIKKRPYGVPAIIEHEGGMTLTVFHNRDGKRQDRGVWRAEGYVTSPVPFILKWRLHSVDAGIDVEEETYIWIFGMKVLVNRFRYEE